MSSKPTTTHGGQRQGAGRHKEPGYEKLAKLRYLTEAEETELNQAKLTPRQRVEILLSVAVQKDDNKTNHS